MVRAVLIHWENVQPGGEQLKILTRIPIKYFLKHKSAEKTGSSTPWQL